VFNRSLVLLVLTYLTACPPTCTADSYPWRDSSTSHGEEREQSTETISSIKPPPGFERVLVAHGSYGSWINSLPLKRKGLVARTYNGQVAQRQDEVHRIVDIDVGDRDLQQCADTVIRLRSEYLYSRGELSSIAFNFTSGDRSYFSQWSNGYRPQVQGNDVRWLQQAEADSSYSSLRRYLESVFTYAGTFSLSREMVPVPDYADIRTGDVFIKSGFPGHVVMIADVARDRRTGQTAVLLLQGFMPAMDVHVLSNIYNPDSSPWFLLEEGDPLLVAWGAFSPSCLRRFPDLESR